MPNKSFIQEKGIRELNQIPESQSTPSNAAIAAFNVAIKLYKQQNNFQAAEILRSALRAYRIIRQIESSASSALR